jgi:SAM-dependent methyltransferase
MSEFWEEKYKSIGTLWAFEPADSAIKARDLFAENDIRKILIPGVGYGRNARVFVESGFEVTGIEISKTAIQLARENGLEFPVHRGSVSRMPFDHTVYDGIFCYALIHLLNQNDRRKLLENCYIQLRQGGIMVFVVVSKQNKMYGNGRLVSIDRYLIDKGLTVFFYDSASVEKEFGKFGRMEYSEIIEPVKHLENEEPMKFFQVVCRKK